MQFYRLDEANLVYLVLSKFTEIDLHPDVVDNIEMGYIFEELIRRFSEASNETAGEHFTPREVIRLMVNLLFFDDSEALTKNLVKSEPERARELATRWQAWAERCHVSPVWPIAKENKKKK